RLQIGAVFLLDGAESADARTAHSAAPVRIELAHVDTGVGHRLDAGSDTVVHELVHAPRILGRDVLIHLEPAHGSAETHGKCGDIKAGDRTDSALALQNGFP